MELHELHEHVRRFERNRTKGRRKMPVRIIEPESNCPWCKAPAKYIKSRSDRHGRNTGTHVFYCRVHGWYESEGGDKDGKPIPGSEV